MYLFHSMDFSDSLSDSRSNSALSCLITSFDLKAYRKDTDEGMDKKLILTLNHINMNQQKMMEKNPKNLHQKRNVYSEG